MKRFYIILLCVLSVSLTYSLDLPIPSKSCSTPEEAIRYYLDALAQGDIDKALSVCAIQEYVDHHDSLAKNKRLKGFLLLHTPGPRNNPTFKDLHLWERTAYYARNIRMFYYSLYFDGALDMTERDEKGDKLAAMFNDIGTSLRLDFSIKDIVASNAEFIENPRYITNLNMRLKIDGAQAHAERVLFFRFKDKYYVAGFELLRYGKDWKIVEMGAAFANLPYSGILKRYGSYDELLQNE